MLKCFGKPKVGFTPNDNGNVQRKDNMAEAIAASKLTLHEYEKHQEDVAKAIQNSRRDQVGSLNDRLKRIDHAVDRKSSMLLAAVCSLSKHQASMINHQDDPCLYLAILESLKNAVYYAQVAYAEMLSAKDFENNLELAARKFSSTSDQGLCLVRDIAFDTWERLSRSRAIGDGACFFRAMAILIYGDQNHHAKVRADVCGFLERNRTLFTGTVFCGHNDMDAYLADMKMPFTWGGYYEILAAATVWKVEIRVFDMVHKNIVRFMPMHDVNATCVYNLFYSGNHYDALI